MNIKQLFDDERAVSPVIGVILMVAITVILAAVIGTFVLGLGDSVSDTTPQASFSFDDWNVGNDKVTVVHEGGDSLTDDNSNAINVTSSSGSTEEWESGSSFTIGAGDSTTYGDGAGSFNSGDTVRVVWESPDGSSSATIGSSEAP